MKMFFVMEGFRIMSNLATALLIAAQAHNGQTRRNNLPYLLHPFRVMLRMGSEEEMIIAILHDVIEDTDVTIDDLRAQGFNEDILEAIDLLTKKDGVDYAAYLETVAANPLARRVKIADLCDNMNVREIPDLQESDLKRLDKHHKALRKLENAEQCSRTSNPNMPRLPPDHDLNG